MSQSQSEIAKEIVIAAIQNGIISVEGKDLTKTTTEVNTLNAQEISNFYKIVYQAVLNPHT